MTRGQRHGQLTRATLVERLQHSPECRELTAAETQAPLLKLLGHAKHYGVVNQHEEKQTVPRVETTIPCYLRPLLANAHASTEEARVWGDVIDRYVVTASKLYHRGSALANYIAMHLYGPRETDEAARTSRPFVLDDGATAQYVAFANPRDVRNSALKQVFLPERWPLQGGARSAARHPIVQSVLAQKAHLLPELPADWRDVLLPYGWDNALNRMATKFAGNINVHCRARLKHRTAEWLASTRALASTHGTAAIPVLGEALAGKLRPLAVHDDDWAMLLHLRRVLGVWDEEPVYPPPDMAPEFTNQVLALHMFVTRYGPRENAYMPVVRRGRKYAYLDAKIAKVMKASVARKVDAAPDDGRRREQDAASASASSGRGDGGGNDGDDEEGEESASVGSVLGITPDAFNAKMKAIRALVRKKLRQRARNREAPRDARNKLKKKARNLGAGLMNRDALIQSLETDGVGARLCVKTPVPITPYDVPLPALAEPSGNASSSTSEPYPKRRRRRSPPRSRDHALKPTEETARRYPDHLPIFVAADTGRKKLWVAAVSTDPRKKPRTETFTRAQHYADMKYWRHRKWCRDRASQPHVSQALVAMSQAGGLRNCNPETWDATMAAERAHARDLDAEYVDDAAHGVWKMRLFRKKRGSLDRATYGLMRRAVEGAPRERELQVSIGDGSFRPTGRGEMAVPTTKLGLALVRSARRLSRADGGMRRVELSSISEYGTTMCCSACGSLSSRHRVQIGTPEERWSRRLRLCPFCEGDTPAGKLRDRDVQGARNILWVHQHQYYGGGASNRPWYLTLRGRRLMSRGEL